VGSNKSRKDMRAVVSLVARYRSPTTFEYANESCSDVSVGGMFILSAAPAPAGTLLKLECDTDSGNSEAKIRGVARVVWLRRESSEHGPAGMGVKFVKLEAGSRELIDTIVQRLAEAGVQARSVSAAPEHRLAAAAGGGTASFAPAAPASPSPVKLVPSTPPGAADGRELPHRGEPAAAPDDEEPVATESWPQPAPPVVDDMLIGAGSAANNVADLTDDSRPSLGATGSSRPPAPKPSRFGWKFWVGAIVLILIAIAIADRRGLGPQTPVTPETHVSDTTPAPSAPVPPPSAASPTPAPPLAEPAAAPEPAAAAPQPKAAEPAPAPEAKPTAAAAPEAKPAPAAPSGATSEAPSGVTSSPIFPSVPGQPDYVVDFVSQPNTATVTIDEKTTLVTPATINLGAMPDKIKVTAKKPGFKSSSIWMRRDGFELKAGVLKRRAVITLREEPSPTP
jgi:molecular chaperone DnaK